MVYYGKYEIRVYKGQVAEEITRTTATSRGLQGVTTNGKGNVFLSYFIL